MAAPLLGLQNFVKDYKSYQDTLPEFIQSKEKSVTKGYNFEKKAVKRWVEIAQLVSRRARRGTEVLI
jgi:hypothetical protein